MIALSKYTSFIDEHSFYNLALGKRFDKEGDEPPSIAELAPIVETAEVQAQAIIKDKCGFLPGAGALLDTVTVAGVIYIFSRKPGNKIDRDEIDQRRQTFFDLMPEAKARAGFKSAPSKIGSLTTPGELIADTSESDSDNNQINYFMSQTKPEQFIDYPQELKDKSPWTNFRGVVQEVTDGDTIDLIVSVGFDIYAYVPIRLENVSAPELGDPKGPEAKAYLQALCPEGTPCVLDSEGLQQTFNRYVGVIELIGDVNVNDAMNTWIAQNVP